MDVKSFLKTASTEEIIQRIADLTLSSEETSISELREFLFHPFNYNSDHEDVVSVAHLACLGLIQKGVGGVQALKDSLLGSSTQKPPKPDAGAILITLWCVTHKQPLQQGMIFKDLSIIPPLNTLPSDEAITAAHQAFYDIIEESQFNEDLFIKLLIFLTQSIFTLGNDENIAVNLLRNLIFEVFAEPAIKITNRLINRLDSLITESHSEETYQQFLSNHPVFIDPLASQVIAKQKLGLEHVTDFVVRRLDNEYILVEIEKPQDAIFTSGDDFTAKFSHAYGQVIDFQEWVDTHGEYARSLLPEISAPKGLLIMGMKAELSERQIAKLKRFNINSKSVEVVTFDDLLRKAKDLYRNIHTNQRRNNQM
jgi:hypothetical protein